MLTETITPETVTIPEADNAPTLETIETLRRQLEQAEADHRRHVEAELAELTERAKAIGYALVKTRKKRIQNKDEEGRTVTGNEG